MSHENKRTTIQRQFAPAAYSQNSSGLSQPAVPALQRKVTDQEIEGQLPDSSKSMKIAVETHHPASQGPVAQLTIANIEYGITGGKKGYVAGKEIGKGGKGGVSHSEQDAWENAEEPIKEALKEPGTKVDVNFIVDAKICSGCVPWFENTVWTELNTAAQKYRSSFTLTVTIISRKKTTAGGTAATDAATAGVADSPKSVTVIGANTIWPSEVADEPTYHRLNPIARSMRYLKENRDEAGMKMAVPENDYVMSQIGHLKGAMADIEYYTGRDNDRDEYKGENMDKSTKSEKDMMRVLDRAIIKSIAGNKMRFEATEDQLTTYLKSLSLSQAIRSGMIGLSELNVTSSEAAEGEITTFLRDLTDGMAGWFTYMLDEHFGEVEKRRKLRIERR